jgi:hypothetical protein
MRFVLHITIYIFTNANEHLKQQYCKITLRITMEAYVIYNIILYSLTPFSKANSCLCSNRVSVYLWNQTVYSHVQKIPWLISIVSHMNPVHTVSHSFLHLLDLIRSLKNSVRTAKKTQLITVTNIICLMQFKKIIPV